MIGPDDLFPIRFFNLPHENFLDGISGFVV